MRRIKHVQEQMSKEGGFASRHVSDKDNVVIDFFGKYVSGKKATQSANYLMNKRMQVDAGGVSA